MLIKRILKKTLNLYCTSLYIYVITESWYLDGISSSLAGIWIKPSRTSRMREKRADFVAGCLGGRVIVAGGLGEHRFKNVLFIFFLSSEPRRRCRKPGTDCLTAPVSGFISFLLHFGVFWVVREVGSNQK